MEATPYGIIYCLTCKVNGKVYIGQTTEFDIRMTAYKRLDCKAQILIYNALKKYGPENFLYETIDKGVSKEDLDQLECYHMALANSRNRNFGYNIRGGGSRGKFSEETKKKMSIFRKNNPYLIEHLKKVCLNNIGKPHTDEHKQNISKSMTGLKRTEHTKKKISHAKKGIKFSEEHKRKLSEAKKRIRDSKK